MPRSCSAGWRNSAAPITLSPYLLRTRLRSLKVVLMVAGYGQTVRIWRCVRSAGAHRFQVDHAFVESGYAAVTNSDPPPNGSDRAAAPTPRMAQAPGTEKPAPALLRAAPAADRPRCRQTREPAELPQPAVAQVPKPGPAASVSQVRVPLLRARTSLLGQRRQRAATERQRATAGQTCGRCGHAGPAPRRRRALRARSAREIPERPYRLGRAISTAVGSPGERPGFRSPGSRSPSTSLRAARERRSSRTRSKCRRAAPRARGIRSSSSATPSSASSCWSRSWPASCSLSASSGSMRRDRLPQDRVVNIPRGSGIRDIADVLDARRRHRSALGVHRRRAGAQGARGSQGRRISIQGACQPARRGRDHRRRPGGGASDQHSRKA